MAIQDSFSALSQTLYSITAIKLAQLSKQKTAFEKAKISLLKSAENESSLVKRVKILVDGAEKLPTMSSIEQNPSIKLENIRRVITQAEYDPSVTTDILAEYEVIMRHEFEVHTNKYELATLYGRLVNEWIESGKDDRSQDEVLDGAQYVAVGREEMHKQRKTWEEYVFQPRKTDPASIKTYLASLFEAQQYSDAAYQFKKLVKNIKAMQKKWRKLLAPFNTMVVSNTIRRLLVLDTTTNKKRATLKELLGKDVVLSEIADVLNMRWQSIDTWNWESPVYVEQHRHLNGRYRFYLDEEVLEALFLNYVGQLWAVNLRKELRQFLLSPGVFLTARQPMSPQDARRRKYYLDGVTELSLEKLREQHFFKEIVLDHLPDKMDEVRGGYYDSDTDESEHEERPTHSTVILKLLHRIAADIILAKSQGSNTTVLRSDFKWFGPSLPHSTIFAVLEFFGVQSYWIAFFRRVLEVPLRFRGDPGDAPAQKRRTGTPFNTPLGNFFGEAVLFVLDFAVNRHTNGTRLYRLHDDIWLWGSPETCLRGWETMKTFTKLMGLEFNEEKTGCCSIPFNSSVQFPPSGLPDGDVKWGFLRLDSCSGRFVINQNQVQEHIAELRIQLSSCKTIFDWIQAWNIYACRFFNRNLGKPANCFSWSHVEDMLRTFRSIQNAIFGPDSNVCKELKRMISENFDIDFKDIPDGFIYFPLKLGGLGVQNPFIELSLIQPVKDSDHTHKGFLKDSNEIMNEFFESEEADYQEAKKNYEKRIHDGNGTRSAAWLDLEDTPFFSFEEYTQNRELASERLVETWKKLLNEPEQKSVQIEADMQSLANSINMAFTPEEQYIIHLYGRSVTRQFGGLRLVDKGLLPMGLIDMVRNRKFKWEG